MNGTLSRRLLEDLHRLVECIDKCRLNIEPLEDFGREFAFAGCAKARHLAWPPLRTRRTPFRSDGCKGRKLVGA